MGAEENSRLGDGTVAIDLAGAVTIPDFLRARQGGLTLAQMDIIVDKALRLLDEGYVHLPVKRAIYAVDPVQRLRNLRTQLARLAELEEYRSRHGALRSSDMIPPTDDLWFHREMSDTLTTLRDLHTTYVLPTPFDRAVAFVPFQIEQYFEEGRYGFTIANVFRMLDWFSPPGNFAPGAEITHWNGIPIARAVEIAGERNAGGNPDARLERGLARLTIRPLARAVPPDEEQVTVAYRLGEGPLSEVKVAWRIVTLPPAQEPPSDGSMLREAMGMGTGLDHETDTIRQMRKELFAKPGEAPAVRTEMGATSAPITAISDVRLVADVTDGLEAKTFIYDADTGRRYGYVRIRSFNHHDHERFLDAFINLLERLPEHGSIHGLIIDVRDNPGGNILCGERLLQTLTPRTIEPEPLQFIYSPLTLQLCKIFPEYGPWLASLERATATGNRYSAAMPLSSGSVALCNDRGQRFYGPVVLITNALCYSTTDIFAAGFQDHRIGRVLGTDRRTGAGGANVVEYSFLCRRFEKVMAAAQEIGNDLPDWPLADPRDRGDHGLPLGVDLRLAIRRTLRVGQQAGIELEDFGVTPDSVHQMTKRDVLEGNIDLLAKAASMLKDLPAYRLRTPLIHPGDGSLVVETQGIDRLDVLADGWSCGSRAVDDGFHEIPLPPAPAKRLELRGYRLDAKSPAPPTIENLVAARKIILPAQPA